MFSDDAPATVPEDFGFHFEVETVQLAAIALNRFHIPPSVFFQERWELIIDVLRYLNIRDAVKDSGEKFYPADVYEDQSSFDLPRMTL